MALFPSFWSVLLLLSLVAPAAVGFFPNRDSFVDSLGDSDLTHEEITEIGVTRAVARHLSKGSVRDEDLPDVDTVDPRGWFESRFHNVVHTDNFWNAVIDIASKRERYHQRWLADASKNMNGERIIDGHHEIQTIRGTILASLSYSAIYASMRIYIGHALHILQMFYSNTNWVEMKGVAVEPNLGRPNRELRVAHQLQATCRNCLIATGSCSGNLLIKNVLTSGYKSQQDTMKPDWSIDPHIPEGYPKVPRKTNEGKCSHGGILDNYRKIPATGGINKDSSNPYFSPHHYLHRDAAQAAILATEDFFTGKEFGLFNKMKNDQIAKLFNIRLTRGSLVFVIDVTGSMQQEIAAVKNKTIEIVEKTRGTNKAPSSFILATFSDPEHMTTVSETNNAELMIEWLRNITVDKGGDCEEYAFSGLERALEKAAPRSNVYLFTDAPPKNPAKLQLVLSRALSKLIRITPILTGGCGTSKTKRSSKKADGVRPLSRETRSSDDYRWYTRYKQLADRTGGQVYQTKDTMLNETLAVLEEAIVQFPVEILRGILDLKSTAEISIPVDDKLWDLRITIEGTSDSRKLELLMPNGNDALPGPYNVTALRLTTDTLLITVKDPGPGVWKLRRKGSADRDVPWMVFVSAESKLDFSFKLFEEDNGMKFEVSGRPVTEATVTAVLKVSKVGLANIRNVVFKTEKGIKLLIASLKQGKGRSKQRFRAMVRVPDKPFWVYVVGETESGYVFQRMRTSPFIPTSMKLKILPMSSRVVAGSTVTIEYRIFNTGHKNETYRVQIVGDRNFLEDVTEKKHFLLSGSNETGFFKLKAKLRAGATSLITVSASIEKIRRASVSQFDVIELTIYNPPEPKQEKEVDREPPRCSYSLLTDAQTCADTDERCCGKSWRVRLQVEDRANVTEVIPSGRNTNMFNVNNKTRGNQIVLVDLSGLCCNPSTFVYTKDSAGNQGNCFIVAHNQTADMSLIDCERILSLGTKLALFASHRQVVMISAGVAVWLFLFPWSLC